MFFVTSFDECLVYQIERLLKSVIEYSWPRRCQRIVSCLSLSHLWTVNAFCEEELEQLVNILPNNIVDDCPLIFSRSLPATSHLLGN